MDDPDLQPARRRHTRTTVVAVAAIAGLLIGAVSIGEDPASAPAAAVVAGGRVRTWTSTEGGEATEQRYTLAEALTIAKRFDLILGLKGTFTADGVTPLMKWANPDLRMIVYSNGTHTQPDEGTRMNESWFADDPSGARVLNVTWNNPVMNPRNPGWVNYVANRCIIFMARAGADGCYLDDMGVGNLTTNFSAVPVDPTTGARYTDAGWIDATSKLAAAVKARLPGALIFSNGLNNGSTYLGAAQSWRLLVATDGSEAEGFVRGDRSPLAEFRPEDEWRQDVDMLVDAGRRGKVLLAKTKVWVSATESQRVRWYRYALATFMLGTDGRSSFAFNAQGPGKPDRKRSLETRDFGSPRESYARVGGVYRRAWSKGTVYVNPSDAAATVPLGRPMETLDGAIVTSLTIGPHTADIVRPSTARCGGLTPTRFGTSGNDVINGTPRRDVITGLGGSDTINGLGDADVICGGAGRDTLSGGDGKDILYGGGDGDRLLGQPGADWLDGQGGTDALNGGTETDTCRPRTADVLVACETLAP